MESSDGYGPQLSGGKSTRDFASARGSKAGGFRQVWNDVKICEMRTTREMLRNGGFLVRILGN